MTTAYRGKIDLDALNMRIAVGQINELTDEHLAFARQVGAPRMAAGQDGDLVVRPITAREGPDHGHSVGPLGQ